MFTPAPAPALIAAAAALRERVPELCAAIVARIEQSLPLYRDTGTVEGGSLAESVRQNMEYLLTSTLGDAPEDFSASHNTGRRRAQQGVPMAEMLRSYRIGFALFWEAVAEEVISQGHWSERDLTDTATALWWAADEFSAAATEAYRETTAELVEQRERQRSALLEALITSGGLDRGAVWEIAEKLGLPRAGSFAAVAAEVGEIGTEPLPGIAVRLRELGVWSAWRLLPRLQVGIVSLPSAELEPLVTALEVAATARIGVSPVYPALEGTPHAVYLAKIALSSIGGGPPRVSRFAATPLAILVAAAPDAAAQIARTVLGPLLALPRDEQDLLLDTLGTWLDTAGSARDTAARMSCHANTVRHRLHRIAEHTGRSVEDPAAAAELAAALAAVRLLPEARWPEPGTAPGTSQPPG
ncbi:MAG TPA: helix-turn-helix domain-containing protein [Pseudonocardia sp.]|nr:helix-turn-helix domain-containing protein [Pseudonocardia sp.]